MTVEMEQRAKVRLDGHRVTQAKPGQAKRCFRDRRSRVLFAPEAKAVTQ
jgi:hypothetical protein